MEISDFIKHSLLPIIIICKFILGTLCVTLLLLFFTLTFPVYIFRLVVIQLAKTFRPDLGEIVSNISAYLVSDFFLDKPQRANNVLTLVIKGKLSYEEMKEDFLREWITQPKISSYEKFTQYPVHWLGFTFWKKARDTFKIENYIKVLTPEDKVFTEDDWDNVITKLMNTRFAPNQSPWQLFLVENYKPENSSATDQHCLVVFKWHHGLADGYSVLVALMHGFFKDFAADQLKLPNMQFPKRNLLDKIFFAITFPIRAFRDMSIYLTHTLLTNPLKVPDHKKKWHQVCVRSKPISVQDVKAIKNCAGVSYTSVLLSAISAAIDKSVNKNGTCVKSTLCASPLPMPEPVRNPALTNYVTTAIFDLPVGPFNNSIERLKATHEELQANRDSIVPYLVYNLGWFVGNHFNFVSRLFHTRSIGAGLTNFAGVPTKIGKDDKTCTQCYTVAGALPGEIGLAVTAVSHGEQIYMQMSAEAALMSKEEAQNFVETIAAEIKHLLEVVVHGSTQNCVTNGKKVL